MRRAVSETDFAAVARLRALGFRRLAKHDGNRNDTWLDAVDFASANRVLIAGCADDMPIATLRIQDGRAGPIELASFVDLEALLSQDQHPVAQLARLSAPTAPRSGDAVWALFKAAWRWCAAHSFRTIVVASPFWARPLHKQLLFRDLGERGVFSHPSAPRPHRTMVLDLTEVDALWHAANHPLTAIFLAAQPDLDFD